MILAPSLTLSQGITMLTTTNAVYLAMISVAKMKLHIIGLPYASPGGGALTYIGSIGMCGP